MEQQQQSHDDKDQYLYITNQVKKGQKMYEIDIRNNNIYESVIEHGSILGGTRPVRYKRIKLTPFMAYVPAISKKVALDKFSKNIKKEMGKILTQEDAK